MKPDSRLQKNEFHASAFIHSEDRYLSVTLSLALTLPLPTLIFKDTALQCIHREYSDVLQLLRLSKRYCRGQSFKHPRVVLRIA